MALNQAFQAPQNPSNPAELLRRLAKEGGAIVSSDSCSELEIACAAAEGRFYVDHNHLGYVLRPAKWLQMRDQAERTKQSA